jgi:hypothetical protein
VATGEIDGLDVASSLIGVGRREKKMATLPCLVDGFMVQEVDAVVDVAGQESQEQGPTWPKVFLWRWLAALAVCRAIPATGSMAVDSDSDHFGRSPSTRAGEGQLTVTSVPSLPFWPLVLKRPTTLNLLHPHADSAA